MKEIVQQVLGSSTFYTMIPFIIFFLGFCMGALLRKPGKQGEQGPPGAQGPIGESGIPLQTQTYVDYVSDPPSVTNIK